MATSNSSHPQPFHRPKFRHLLAIFVLLWLSLVGLILFDQARNGASWLTDPITGPIFYMLLFGSGSLWVFREYRQQGIDVRSLLGGHPAITQWRPALGLWATLFVFSLGTFQVSFTLFSFLFPQHVERVLRESIFLGTSQTAFPWLYNLLTLCVLVVAAPILEEFLFRGFLLHRWGTRWNPTIAVLLSSLLFGILHSNILGLSVFGLVMSLLYLRTGSLGLVILIHSVNNACAALLEVVTRLVGGDLSPSLDAFRSNVWLGCLLVAVSTPFLVKFVRSNWQVTRARLPYFVHRDRR